MLEKWLLQVLVIIDFNKGNSEVQFNVDRRKSALKCGEVIKISGLNLDEYL